MSSPENGSRGSVEDHAIARKERRRTALARRSERTGIQT